MSNLDRMYRPDVYLGLAYLEAFANPSAPTAAELNNATYVKDITCALWEDGTEFTLGDSDSDDGLTFCSNAGDTTLTTKNPTVTYKALRDKDRVAGGVYNLAFDHLAFPDIDFYAIERLGKANTTAFAIGDQVRIVQVKTDNPADDASVDNSIFIVQNFLPNNFINWNYSVAS
jgi:hypothetical protein